MTAATVFLILGVTTAAGWFMKFLAWLEGET